MGKCLYLSKIMKNHMHARSCLSWCCLAQDHCQVTMSCRNKRDGHESQAWEQRLTSVTIAFAACERLRSASHFCSKSWAESRCCTIRACWRLISIISSSRPPSLACKKAATSLVYCSSSALHILCHMTSICDWTTWYQEIAQESDALSTLTVMLERKLS